MHVRTQWVAGPSLFHMDQGSPDSVFPCITQTSSPQPCAHSSNLLGRSCVRIQIHLWLRSPTFVSIPSPRVVRFKERAGPRWSMESPEVRWPDIGPAGSIQSSPATQKYFQHIFSTASITEVRNPMDSTLIVKLWLYDRQHFLRFELLHFLVNSDILTYPLRKRRLWIGGVPRNQEESQI